MFVCSLGTVACCAYVSLVLLSSVEAIAIVTGVVLSITWLKEPFVWQYDVPGITIVIIGCALVVVLVNAPEQEYTLAELSDLIKSPKSVGFLIWIASMFVLTIIATWIMLARLELFEKQAEQWVL